MEAIGHGPRQLKHNAGKRRPWAAKLVRSHARAVAAALRLNGGIQAFVCDDGHLWLRGDDLDESLDATLRKLAPLARYRIGIDQTSLIRVDCLLPEAQLPQGRWISLQELCKVDRPVAAIPAPAPHKVGLTIVRSELERTPTLLETSLSLWTRYAITAAAIRLRPLRFVATAQSALIWGTPLPPLPGTRSWERDGIVVPCGFDWSPPVDAITLRRVLGLEANDLAIFHADGTWDRVPSDAFVAARRSAVRRTAEGVA